MTSWSTSDFEMAARLGGCLAREYARAVFDLLVSYQDISASETASRLGLHVRTAQDFLESLHALDIVAKTEVHEGKRPYFRYTLSTHTLTVSLDLSAIPQPRTGGALDRRIRELANARAGFTTARGDSAISTISLWSGSGRDRKQRRISLTPPQGRFLFHLPFPDAEPLSIAEIISKAGLDDELAPEILDIVRVLADNDVIEMV